MLAEYRQLLKFYKKDKDYRVTLVVFSVGLIILGLVIIGRLAFLKTQVTSLRKYVGELDSQFAQAKAQEVWINSLLLENKNLKTDNENLRQAVARMMSVPQAPDLSSLKSENLRLQTENASARLNYRNLKAQYETAAAENIRLKTENTHLNASKSSHDDSLAENGILKAENEALRKEIEHLKDQINLLQVSLLRIFKETGKAP